MRGNLGACWTLKGNTLICVSAGASLSLCKHYEQFSLLVLSTFDNVMSVICRHDGSCGVPLPLVTVHSTRCHQRTYPKAGHPFNHQLLPLNSTSPRQAEVLLWQAVTLLYSYMDCFHWPQTCFVTVGASLALREFFTRGFNDSKVETD